MTRHCQHCGAPAPDGAPTNWRYCNKHECQNARLRENHKNRNERLAKEPKTCSICGKEFYLKPGAKPWRKTCYEQECIDRLKVISRQAAHETMRSRVVEVECLKCGRKFNTTWVMDGHKIPRNRLCNSCHWHTNEEKSLSDWCDAGMGGL